MIITKSPFCPCAAHKKNPLANFLKILKKSREGKDGNAPIRSENEASEPYLENIAERNLVVALRAETEKELPFRIIEREEKTAMLPRTMLEKYDGFHPIVI